MRPQPRKLHMLKTSPNNSSNNSRSSNSNSNSLQSCLPKAANEATDEPSQSLPTPPLVDNPANRKQTDTGHPWAQDILQASSAKNISVRAEWLRQSGRAPSEPSETPRWQITPRLASLPRVPLHIALRSLFQRFFLLCRSPILNERSGVVANCDHTSEWVHWVRSCIGIAMRWVTLRKSLLVFLLPARKMQFSLY